MKFVWIYNEIESGKIEVYATKKLLLENNFKEKKQRIEVVGENSYEIYNKFDPDIPIAFIDRKLVRE